MKFLCPACERLTAFSGFRAEGDLLVLRCSRCGVESRSGACAAEVGESRATAPPLLATAVPPVELGLKEAPPAPAAFAEPAPKVEDFGSVPDGHCPKCVALRPAQAISCSQCGLVFANFKPEALEPSPAIAEQFQRLLSNWADIDGHDRLLQAALVQGDLAAVGRLYRIQLARAPLDPHAARGRDEVLRLATAGSPALPKAESAGGPRASGPWKYPLLFAILAACAIVFFALYRQLRTATS